MSKQINEQDVKKTIEINTNINTEKSLGTEQASFAAEEKKVQPIIRKKAFYSDDEYNYMEKILETSKDENIKTRIRVLDTVESEWEVTDIRGTKDKKPFFMQQLPKAKKDKKWGSTETDAVKKASKTFKNADLCTVREMASMNKYLEDKKKEEQGKTTLSLDEYVDLITGFDLNAAKFTDDYLSQNMPKIFEYAKQLQRYETLKGRHPRYFEDIPSSKRVILESRAPLGAELEELLTVHMKMHGLVFNGEKADRKMKLRKESAIPHVREDERDRIHDEYYTKLDNFCKKALKNTELNIAKSYLNNDIFKAENSTRELEKEVEANEKARDALGDEMNEAMAEIKKAYALRDRILEEQKGLVQTFENKGLSRDERQAAGRRLLKNNKIIEVVSQHAEHYREFMDYCLGKKDRVSRNTITFMIRDGRRELGDIISFRDTADALGEALVVNQKLKLKEQLNEKMDLINGAEPVISEKDGFEIIDEKADVSTAREEAKRIEEEIRKLTYVKIPADSFYALIKSTKYKEARKKKDTMLSLAAEAAAKQAEANEKAREMADEKKLERNVDRTFGYITDPFGKIKNKDYLSLACHYHPSKETSQAVKDEIRDKGLKPIVKELLSLTPQKIASMKLSDKTDIRSEEFWHNRMLLNIGADMKDFMDKLRNWNVDLTDEEYSKLQAFGMVAQSLYGVLGEYELLAKDPTTVLLDTPEIRENWEGLYSNVFQNEGEGIPEVEGLFDNYSIEKLGYSKSVLKVSKDKMKKASIASHAQNLIGHYAFKVQTAEGTGSNIALDYQREYENVKNELNKPLMNELNKVKVISEKYGEKEAMIRLQMKKHMSAYEETFSKDHDAKWKKAYPNNTMGGDFRCFKGLMRRVEKDANGTLSDEALRNKTLNERDFEDYISGDEKRRNAVLYSIGKKIAKIRITPEMVSEEYLTEHFNELYADIKYLFDFQNIHDEYSDFFESDAFSEEERDAIRRYYTYNPLAELLTNLKTLLVQRYGVNDDSNDIVLAENIKNDKERGEKLRQHILIINETIKGIMEDPGDGIEARLAQVKKYENAFKEKPDEVRRACSLFAAAKARAAKAVRKSDADEKREAAQELKLATEVRDHVLGFKEGELSPEAKELYDTKGKLTVLHREFIKRDDSEFVPLVRKDLKEADSLFNEIKREQKEEAKEEKKEEVKEEKKEEIKEELPPLPEYHVATKLTVNDYSQQSMRNCWCVAGSTLYNAFIGKKEVDQKDFRGFSPKDDEIKTLEEVQKMSPTITREEYESQIAERREYMGEGKEVVGNIYEAADFFIKRDRNMAVRSLTINLPSLKNRVDNQHVEKSAEEKERDSRLYHEQKKVFLDEVSKVLSGGNPVTILNSHDAHYQTITKINGEMITLLESSGLKEETKHIDMVLSRHEYSNFIELNWLTELKTPEEELKDQPNLKYSEEEGYGIKEGAEEDLMINSRNPMWVEGISVSRKVDKLGINYASYYPLKKSFEERKNERLKADEPIGEQEQQQQEQEEQEKQGQEQQDEKKGSVNEENENKIIEENESQDEKLKESDFDEIRDNWDLFDEKMDSDTHDLDDYRPEMEDMSEYDGVMANSKLVKGIERDGIVADYYITDETMKISVETEEEKKEKSIAIKRMNNYELKIREKDPGTKIPENLMKLAAKEKGMKGSFSKEFLKNSEDFIAAIEGRGVLEVDEEVFQRAMGVKSPVELLYVGGQPISDYVKDNYGYGGNDVGVLRCYAALIAAKMEQPLVYFCPKIEKGNLFYETRNVNFELPIKDEKDKVRNLEFRREGIREEQRLRGNVPIDTAVKAGRTFRKREELDTYGFAGIEDIADRIAVAKKGSNRTYLQFLTLFNSYYVAVERFAYHEVDRSGFARLNSYLIQALEAAMNYMKGKKVKEERHSIANDAIRELKKHRKIFTNAFENGALKGEMAKLSFSELFRLDKEALKGKQK